MQILRLLGLLALSVFTSLSARAAELLERTWMVAGVERSALVAKPRKPGAGPAPVVFVFHGHGGSARNAARSFALHEAWPEACIVYPQGLPTPGKLTDPEGKRSGWQSRPGDQGDRDLAFFDTVRASLAQEPGLDAARVFATGHSNGGSFTYLLWAERHAVLRAVAPSAAVLAARAAKLRPLPVLHLAGMNDELVKFSWQERMLDAVLRVNGGGARQPAAPGEQVYPPSGDGGALTVLVLHEGGHAFPKDGGRRIAEFFRARS
jgi:polyhydroxybutyrate depolymerase